MLGKLFLLFVGLPLVELALLLVLGDVTDWWIPVLVVVVTGVVGATLARLQGLSTYRRIQAELSEGKMPADAMLDAVMIFFAGALLLTPGLITDVVGLLLLLPLFRSLFKQRLTNWFVERFTVTSYSSYSNVDEPAPREDVIDSYVVEPEEEPSEEE